MPVLISSTLVIENLTNYPIMSSLKKIYKASFVAEFSISASLTIIGIAFYFTGFTENSRNCWLTAMLSLMLATINYATENRVRD